MVTGQVRTSGSRNWIANAVEPLKEVMRDLGLNLSAWDVDGQPAEKLTLSSLLCEEICPIGWGCQKVCHTVAKRIVAERNSISDRTPTGCCVVGVPVYERRRLRGAAVVCFPVREMLEEEFLSRLCDRLQLDRQAVEILSQVSIRYDTQQADNFGRVLDWLLRREQARVVAHEELAILSTNLATTYEELSLLYRLSSEMRVTQPPEEFLQNLCHELMEEMNIEAALAIAYAHPPAMEQDLVVEAGQTQLTQTELLALASEEVAPKFSGDNRAILDNNVSLSGRQGFQGVENLIAVPLVTDEVIGIIIALNKKSGDFDSVELKLINAVGSQAAVFLANYRLYADVQDLLMGVLHALTATIDAKDPYTCGHSQRVALISRRLAEECGFGQEKVQEIYLAGLLHDIGKIGVPEAILRKEGRLTESEYQDMKRHPEIGARILGGIRQLDNMIVGILTHHERPDGRGYPRGLKDDQVPIEGLIVGLADSFDAMTSERTYRKALPLKTVVEEIRTNAGTQFDPDLAEKLLSVDLEEFMTEIHQPVKAVFPLNLQPESKR